MPVELLGGVELAVVLSGDSGGGGGGDILLVHF